MPRIIIVDENDTPVGVKERSGLAPDDIYRVSGLWITNTSGHILIARRALTKDKNPGRWGPAVAGTIEDGETYESNILKEAEEEIGLTLLLSDIQTGPKTKLHGIHTYFTQWFFLRRNIAIEDLTLDRTEVEEVRWVSRDELLALFQKDPHSFVGTMPEWIDMVLEQTVTH